LSSIEEETIQIQNGVGDIHEVICRQEREISGIRQEVRVVFDYVNSGARTYQKLAYLEHQQTGIEPYPVARKYTLFLRSVGTCIEF
jgi:hypothetical protein